LNLLDPVIQKYIFKWERHENSILNFIPEVQNEKEEKIGTIQVRGGWLQKKFCLCDIKDSTLLHVRKYEEFTGESYDVMDYDDTLIGIVKEKFFSSRHIMTMKNSKGDEILRFNEGGISEFTESDYKINSINGRNIAEFRVKMKGQLRRYYYNTCLLQIHDLNFDRKSILGMFICCMLRILKLLEPIGESGG